MAQDKIVTGIASFGMSGKVFHAPLLTNHEGFYLKTIVERSRDDARQWYPDIQVTKSFDDLLRDPEIDLVVVNTPDHTHAELTHKALMAGKHVVVEKPFALHAGECEDLLNLATRKNKVLSVFQNRRWDGDFLTVQKVIKNEMLGKLVEYEAHFDRFRNYIQPNTWKEDSSSGTGTLYNLGSHLIDQALVLFGMPESVWADIRILRPDGMVDDFFEIVMHYSEIRVALKASYLVREPGPRYSLHGTNGSFLKYGIDPQEEALKQGTSPTGPDWGKDTPEMWGTLNADKGGLHYVGKLETIPGNYMAYYNSIFEAIVNGKELQVKPEEAVNVINVIEAALESSKHKRTIGL
jgi:predicted dehydrogenase